MGDDARQLWFAQMIQAGLEEKIIAPKHLLAHVTPELLAEFLPGEILGEILSSSLESRALTAEAVLDTVTPEILAEHIPHDVLWTCVAEAAERAGISRSDRSA